MFEAVHTMTCWWDGPRAGIADFQGVPHAFESDGDEDVNGDAVFLLMPLDTEAFSLAREDWSIWRRWETAYHRGETTLDTHPALPADRCRHEELKRLIGDRLKPDAARAVRKGGEFQPRQDPTWNGRGMEPLEVRWFEPRAE